MKKIKDALPFDFIQPRCLIASFFSYSISSSFSIARLNGGVDKASIRHIPCSDSERMMGNYRNPFQSYMQPYSPSLAQHEQWPLCWLDALAGVCQRNDAFGCVVTVLKGELSLAPKQLH